MAVELRDYQIDAISRMKNGCILCGGVGSGKSRTSLAYYFMEEGGELEPNFTPMCDPPKDLYIITTARKRDTLEWESELIPFNMSTHKEFNLYSNKIVVDSWNNISKYVDVKDAFFIFDEQRVVGTGAWVKAFLKITKVNNWILLSGTPGDTWTDYMPVFLANGFYKNSTEFKREHIVYSPFCKNFPKIDRFVNTKRLIRLRDSILVDMDFKRETVSHHEDVWCNYDIFQYKDMMKNRWNIWEDKPIENAAELCYALRKISNSASDRQLKLLELVEKHPRVIIFYNFDYELEILREICKSFNRPMAEWNGHQHNEIPLTDEWIYLVQYTAGCEGWNCIKTDTIIFFSQNYSYKVMEQARGRIDRMNTPYRDLYYYHLKSRSNIDLAISRAVANKKKFNEGRFVSNGGSL